MLVQNLVPKMQAVHAGAFEATRREFTTPLKSVTTGWVTSQQEHSQAVSPLPSPKLILLWLPCNLSNPQNFSQAGLPGAYRCNTKHPLRTGIAADINAGLK
jgi:hypothetical protein